MVVSYLALRTEGAPQREYRLGAVCNALRWRARRGAAWRMLPPDLPPWAAVYQQTQRWRKGGVFEALLAALRVVVRVAQGRAGQPSAAKKGFVVLPRRWVGERSFAWPTRFRRLGRDYEG